MLNFKQKIYCNLNAFFWVIIYICTIKFLAIVSHLTINALIVIAQWYSHIIIYLAYTTLQYTSLNIYEDLYMEMQILKLAQVW